MHLMHLGRACAFRAREFCNVTASNVQKSARCTHIYQTAALEIVRGDEPTIISSNKHIALNR